MNDVLREIRAAFAKRGNETYGEGVSQLDHALQCAACAERDQAPAALIVASLLHDIGHLVHDLPEDSAEQGIDTQHESLGSAWLSRYFGAEVSEPVRLHVAAKRYLAATEAGYGATLSPASQLSLRLQGGPMSAEEIGRFRRETYWREALRLRRWDEEGKIPDLPVPGLHHFEPLIRAAAGLG